MPKRDELPDVVRVAFFGKWEGVDPQSKVEAPDPEELCYRCITAIGSRANGASVRTDQGDWVHYHGDCYMDAIEESEARDSVADALDAEDLDRW